MVELTGVPACGTCVHRDMLEVFKRTKIKRRTTKGKTWSRRLCYIIGLLGGPELFVLLPSEALVVVAFAFEKLLEVGLAVKLALEGCEAAEAQFGFAVLAAETRWMENQVVGNQSLHWVDCLLTWCAHFLLGLKAERLWSLDRFFVRVGSGIHLRL